MAEGSSGKKLVRVTPPGKTPDAEPDSATAQGLQKFDRDRRDLENRQFRENIELRRNTARSLFAIMALWMAATMVLVFFQGFGCIGGHPFHLNEWTLRVLITTSLATVIGLVFYLNKYLFDGKND
jgi:hypothetical protein